MKKAVYSGIRIDDGERVEGCLCPVWISAQRGTVWRIVSDTMIGQLAIMGMGHCDGAPASWDVIYDTIKFERFEEVGE